MADLEDINDALLPEHRGVKWVGKYVREWAKDTHKTRTLNEEAIFIIQDRVDVLIDRWQVNVHEPYQLSTILNGVTQKYNGLIYEEDGIIMEIDLFNEELEEDEEPYLFGIGNTPIFMRFIYDHHPELLI